MFDPVEAFEIQIPRSCDGQFIQKETLPVLSQVEVESQTFGSKSSIEEAQT